MPLTLIALLLAFRPKETDGAEGRSLSTLKPTVALGRSTAGSSGTGAGGREGITGMSVAAERADILAGERPSDDLRRCAFAATTWAAAAAAAAATEGESGSSTRPEVTPTMAAAASTSALADTSPWITDPLPMCVNVPFSVME